MTPGVTNTIAIISSAEPSAVCTNLPLDGVSSLVGLGTGFAAAPNRLRNFNDQTNHIVPVRFLSQQLFDTNCVMSFATATGVNGSAGPTYSLEYKNNLTDPNWSLLTSAAGNGSTQTVSNSVSEAPQRFFRLNVP